MSEFTKLFVFGTKLLLIDKVFPFEQTNEALDYVETGRSRRNVVVEIK